MRVLLVRPGPSFSVQDVAFGWRDGLRSLGVTVADCNFDDRLDAWASAHIDKSAGQGEFVQMFPYHGAIRVAAQTIRADCFDFWPDILLIVSGFFVPVETIDIIRSRGIKVVLLCTESPYEDNTQIAKAAHVDMVLLNDPTNLEKFKAVNKHSYYVPHAYDPRRHYAGPPDPDKACDFTFVGTGFPSRIQFFESVDLSGLHVIFGGSWISLPEESPLAPFIAHRRDWCMSNEETASLYRSAKTSLNLYRREAGHNGDTPEGYDTIEGWACGPREIELAACRTFFLRDPRPESDELFPMLPTFSEAAEVRPLLDWWLSHDSAREEATLKAQAAIADRTFTANAQWLLETIGE